MVGYLWVTEQVSLWRRWFEILCSQTDWILLHSQISSESYSLLFDFVIPPRESRESQEWLSDKRSVVSVIQSIEEYDWRVKKLTELASSSRLLIQTFQDSPQHVSKHNELVLIGDAVHSIYNNGTQHTAAAFEEAFTFGRLFSMPSKSSQSKEHVSHLLNGYRCIQQKRTRALEGSSMDTIGLVTLMSGPEREGRNNGFRLTLDLDGADDAILEKVWAGYIAQFNYDARDAVDEWWMNWSKLSGRRLIGQILAIHESSFIAVDVRPSDSTLGRTLTWWCYAPRFHQFLEHHNQ